MSDWGKPCLTCGAGCGLCINHRTDPDHRREDYLMGSGKYTPVQARILLADLNVLDPARCNCTDCTPIDNKGQHR